MAMSIETQLDLCVDKLYGSLTNPAGLADAIHDIRLMFNASGATHLFFNQRGQLTGLVDDGHDPGAARLYEEHYGAIDPTRTLLTLRQGEWLRDDRLLDPMQTSQPEFVNDFARHIGMRWFRGCKVYEGIAGTATFSLQRGSDAPPFGDDALVLLDRIKPHLNRVFRLALDMQATIPALAAAGTAMDMLRSPVCVVDAARRVRYANPAAEELLALGGVLKVKDGYLCSTRPEVDERLRRSVSLASRPPREASVFSHAQTASALQRLQVRVVPLAPHLPLAHYGHGNLVLVFFAVGTNPPLRSELQQLFGLTLAEADLAGMLVNGHRLEMCAERRDVSLETVRTQLKSIYSKTGTKSQSQLISLVLALPAVR